MVKYEPAGQDVAQRIAPVNDDRPDGHESHVVAPVDGVKVPGKHRVQVMAPGSEEKVPARHDRHDMLDEIEKNPAEHGSHRTDPVFC